MVYEGGWRSQKYTVRGEEEVTEGGKERMRRGLSQTWSQVQRFPSELWFIMKFQGERAESKPEVTERRAQANNLPSCLCLHPSFLLSLHLYLLCGSVTFTLLSLLRPLRARGSERRMSAATVEMSVCLRDSGAATNPNGIPKHNKSTREMVGVFDFYMMWRQREILFCVFVVV